MNCFQIIVSLTSETTRRYHLHFDACCELLSNYCIFDIWNNLVIWNPQISFVVNCFQIIVSLTSETTKQQHYKETCWLWIAFKLLYLWHLKQQIERIEQKRHCCELLSNYCIFDIWNNKSKELNKKDIVVNCFQIIVSLTSETTSFVLKFPINRCELLSNYCIFDIWNNIHDFFY